MITSEQYKKANAAGLKHRTTAAILAILLGNVGTNNFYLNKIGLGIIDILFCWTFISGLINFIRGIIYLTEGDNEFNSKYNAQNSNI